MAEIPVTITVQSIADGLGDLNLAKETLRSMSAGIKDVQKQAGEFAQAKAVVKEFIDTLTEGTKEFIAFAEQGDRYSNVMKALKVDISGARAALGGTITDMRLAMAANSAYQGGLHLTSEQFAAVTLRAKEFADANAMELDPALQMLIMTLRRGKDRFHQWNLEGADSKTMLQNLVKEYGATEASANNVTDATDHLTTAWKNLTDKVAAGVNENGAFTLVVDKLGKMLDKLTALPGAVDVLATGFTAFVAPAGPLFAMAQGISDVNDALSGTLEIMAQIAESGTNVEDWDAESIRRTVQGLRAIHGHAGEMGDQDASRPMNEDEWRAFANAASQNRIENNIDISGIASRAPTAEEWGAARIQREWDNLARMRGAAPRSRMQRLNSNVNMGLYLDRLMQGPSTDLSGTFEQSEQMAQSLDAQEKFEQRSVELREQWRDRMIQIDRERGDALREQDALNREVEQRARDRWNADLDLRVEKDRYYSEQQQEGLRKEMQAYQDWTATLGGILQQAGEQFGASRGQMLLLEAIQTSAEAVIAWAQALNPMGGQAYYPHAVAMTAAAAFSFAKAAELGAGGRGGGGAPGGVGGSAPQFGSPNAFASYGHQATGWQGEQSIKVDVHIDGSSLHTKDEVSRAVMDAVTHAVDRGRRLPARSVAER